MSHRLRRGTPADAQALTALRFTCQRETYEPLYGTDYVNRIQIGGAAADEDREHLNTPGTRVILAEDGYGEPIGFAIAADGPMDWEREITGEITPERQLVILYTRTFTHGTGLGRELLEAALSGTEAEPVYLWVVLGNHRAEAFYRKCGFSPVGDPVPCDGAWAGQSMYRMRRVVRPGGAEYSVGS